MTFGNLPLGPNSGSSRYVPCNKLVFNESENSSWIKRENIAEGSKYPVISNSVVIFLEPFSRTFISPRIA